MINKIIGAVVTGLVGFSLIPVINEQVKLATTQLPTDTSPFALLLLNNIGIFFGIGVGISIIMMFVSSFMDYGMDYGMEDIEEEVKEEYQPNKRQTYEEYVRERLRVERMMRYGWIGRWL